MSLISREKMHSSYVLEPPKWNKKLKLYATGMILRYLKFETIFMTVIYILLFYNK